jgi:hypothetical protein
MRRGWATALVLLGAVRVACAEPLWIGRFDAATAVIPAPWEIRGVDRRTPATRYQLRHWEGVGAVEALADRSMAMLARPVSVDLAQNPVLCWLWRVDAPIAAADMQRKSGDDYAARLYVGFRLPAASMNAMTRFKLAMARRLFDASAPDAALNYVWDNRQPVGTELPSAYTDRVQMLVLQSGDPHSGRWQQERRNLLQDFQRRFGTAVQPTVEFVALGSDADNTRSQAHAGFADLHFVAADAPCVLSGPAADMRP